MRASVSTEAKSEVKRADAAARTRRMRRGTQPRRWVREVQGISALAVAAFLFVALAVFDPAVPPSHQAALVGPVGIWLAWGVFRSFGYAAFLFPLMAAVWGLSAFVRPLASRGWVPLGGLVLLLLTATGLLHHATDVFAAARVTRGGMVQAGGFIGWTIGAALQTSIGNAGAWLVLLTAVPIGALMVTQTSYTAALRLVSTRLLRLRGRRVAGKPATARATLELIELPAEEPVERVEPQLPTIVEPSRPKSTLMEKGLSWQETFDFGKGGAESFQLPPVGLLHPPPPSELKRTREELQDNAEILRKKQIGRAHV